MKTAMRRYPTSSGPKVTEVMDEIIERKQCARYNYKGVNWQIKFNVILMIIRLKNDSSWQDNQSKIVNRQCKQPITQVMDDVESGSTLGVGLSKL